MSEPRRRRFLLQHSPGEDGRAELGPEESEHALRVLRLGPGDRLDGLDGRGGAWEFEVAAGRARGIELRLVRELRREPRPGSSGAPLPWIEVAAALPKGERAEELVARLAQLGVARLLPLVAERSAEAAREFGSGRRRVRLERIAAEALKQSGRLWALEIGAPTGLEELCADRGRELVLLAPRSTARLFDFAAEKARLGAAGETLRPLCVVAGPEGGFSESERERLVASGARELWLGPHVLRIETACEAAAAILASALGTPRA